MRCRRVLLDGFVIAADRRGVTLAMGAMDPRRATDEAADELAPDVTLDPIEPYMMLSGALAPGTPIPAPGEWTDDTPREMHERMIEAVADWHPALRGLVQRIDLSTMFATHFKRLDPTPAWEPSNVTVMGDAIHAMLPTFGMGGNTSLRDAAILAGALAEAAPGRARRCPMRSAPTRRRCASTSIRSWRCRPTTTGSAAEGSAARNRPDRGSDGGAQTTCTSAPVARAAQRVGSQRRSLGEHVQLSRLADARQAPPPARRACSSRASLVKNASPCQPCAVPAGIDA